MKELKQLIKDLAQEQRDLKPQRKTGPYEIPRTEHGYVDYGQIPEKVTASNNAAGKMRHNKPKITAALNLYHELRGSDYRHGCPDDWSYQCQYERELEVLRKEFKTQAAVDAGLDGGSAGSNPV